MKHSTRAPTRSQQQRLMRIKDGPCMACTVRASNGRMPSHFVAQLCDAHHLKSGNIRMGHDYTIGLCGWHHRGIVPFGYSRTGMREIYGPSLMDGSRRFAAEYGTDAELLDRQNAMLADWVVF